MNWAHGVFLFSPDSNSKTMNYLDEINVNEHEIRNTTMYNECSSNGDTRFSCHFLSNEIAKSINNEYYSDNDDDTQADDIGYADDVCGNKISSAINPTLVTNLKATNHFMKNNKHSMFLSNKMHNSCLNNLQFVKRSKLLDKIKQPFDVNCIERKRNIKTNQIEQCHRKRSKSNNPQHNQQDKEYYAHACSNYIICCCLLVAIMANRSFHLAMTVLGQLKDKLFDYIQMIFSNVNVKRIADTNPLILCLVPFMIIPLIGGFITVWTAYYLLKLVLKPVPKEWAHALFIDNILKDI